MGYYPQFAKLLNQYLEERDRSGTWLARRVGVSATAVSRWRNEKSRPGSPEMMVRIADILGVYDEKKRQEFLVAAGYGYQAPAKKEEVPVESQVADFETPPAPPTDSLSATGEELLLRPKSKSAPSESRQWHHKRPLKPLIGVDEHLKQLEEVLLSGEPPWVVSISGIGGIGKTSLAEALMYRIMGKDAASRAFEGACWLSAQQEMFNLRGNIKPLEPSTLTVKALLETLVMQLLGITESQPHQEALSSVDGLALLQNHLQQHPHLIVLDNLETLTEPEPILATLHHLAAPTKFLLTSRESLFGEADLYHFSLPELSQADALALVKQEAKLRNLPHLYESDDDVLKQIYDTVGGNPLALRLVVGQTHIHHLSVVLGDLAKASGEEAENLYDYIYKQAWHHLDDETRQLFLVMLLVSESGASRDYIEHVSQLAPNVLHNSLALLVTLNLVDVDQDLSAWRYTIHRLTRTFLQKQLAEAGSEAELAILFGSYLKRSAQYIYRQIEQTITPNGKSRTPQKRPALTPALSQLSQSGGGNLAFISPLSQGWERGAGGGEGRSVVRLIPFGTTTIKAPEQELALHILNHALEITETWPEVRNLLLLLAPKMEQAGARSEWMPYLARAISQSRHQGDVKIEAELQFAVGVLHHHQAEFDDARRCFSESATHFEQLGNSHHQARALNRLAATARRQHNFEEASQLAHTALAKTTAKEEMGYSNFVLGAIASDERDWQNAIDYYQKSLFFWEEGDNQRLIAWGLGNLGKALRKLEKYDDAIKSYQRAINLLESIQDPLYQAVARMNLGNVYLKLGQPRVALSYYILAEPIFDKTYAYLSLAQVNFNKGLAYEKLHLWDEAEEVYLASYARWQQIGTVSSVINVMARLGAVYIAQERLDFAIETYQDALSKLTQIKNDPIHNHLYAMLTNHLDEAIRSDSSYGLRLHPQGMTACPVGIKSVSDT